MIQAVVRVSRRPARHVYNRSTGTYFYYKRPLPVLEQRAQISFDVVADFLFTCAGICRYKSLMVGRINQSTALTQRER